LAKLKKIRNAATAEQIFNAEDAERAETRCDAGWPAQRASTERFASPRWKAPRPAPLDGLANTGLFLDCADGWV
jgi:hypothetical protein